MGPHWTIGHAHEPPLVPPVAMLPPVEPAPCVPLLKVLPTPLPVVAPAELDEDEPVHAQNKRAVRSRLKAVLSVESCGFRWFSGF